MPRLHPMYLRSACIDGIIIVILNLTAAGLYDDYQPTADRMFYMFLHPAFWLLYANKQS
jgi:hypothetical protein